VITIECSYEEFGKFLAEIERSPRLITLNEYEVKNGVERVKTNISEEDLIEQVFELNLATITLVKSRTKG
jgi:Tfp pilus assembly protein PilO